jgi:hypothetical protein
MQIRWTMGIASLVLALSLSLSCSSETERCEDSTDCDDGLVCNIALDPPQCVEPGVEGDPCVSKVNLCASDYACECLWTAPDGQVCRRLPGLGEWCVAVDLLPPSTCIFAGCGCAYVCREGLVCSNPDTLGTCMEPEK